MARTFGSGKRLKYSSALVSSPPFSVSLLVYPTQDTDFQVPFSLADEGGGNHVYFLSVDGLTDDRVLWVAGDPGQALAIAAAPYIKDVWQQLGAVESTTSSRAVYINGGNKGVDTTSKSPTGLDNTIISSLQRTSTLYYFDGAIAEVAIWNAALTDDEMAMLGGQELYTSPLLVRPQSLIHYWPIIGRTSPEIDRIGSIDMPVVGAPSVSPHAPVLYPAPPLMPTIAPTAPLLYTGPFPTHRRP